MWKWLSLTFKVAFDIDLGATDFFYHFPNSDGKLICAYHDHLSETCPDTGEVFMAYLGLRGYPNYSKPFFVVTTFTSLILYATSYILVVHTPSTCH